MQLFSLVSSSSRALAGLSAVAYLKKREKALDREARRELRARAERERSFRLWRKEVGNSREAATLQGILLPVYLLRDSDVAMQHKKLHEHASAAAACDDSR